MNDNKYNIDGKTLNQDEKIVVCRCQYGACSPESALDKMFLVSKSDTGIDIINSSENDEFVLLKLPSGSQVTVNTAKRIELYLNTFYTDARNVSVNIIREDEHDEDEWCW